MSDRKCTKEHAQKQHQGQHERKRNRCVLTKLITVLCRPWTREVCLTAEGGTGRTKNYSVKYMRKKPHTNTKEQILKKDST